MSHSQAKIYLVAGATRGIGLAFVDEIAAKDPSAIVYAGARDPSGPGASKLKELVAKYPGRIEVVKYVAGDKESNDAIAKLIGEKHGHVDTVIANAGILNFVGKVHETPADQFQDHFSVNVIGPVVLFQSVRDLLKASPLPRFIPISSGVGSIELIKALPLDASPYGTSKAALNWVTRKIHFENEWLISFPLCPGLVATDMAQKSKDLSKDGNVVFKDVPPPRTPNAAASLLVDIINASTRENNGGQFNNVEGQRYPW